MSDSNAASSVIVASKVSRRKPIKVKAKPARQTAFQRLEAKIDAEHLHACKAGLESCFRIGRWFSECKAYVAESGQTWFHASGFESYEKWLKGRYGYSQETGDLYIRMSEPANVKLIRQGFADLVAAGTYCNQTINAARKFLPSRPRIDKPEAAKPAPEEPHPETLASKAQEIAAEAATAGSLADDSEPESEEPEANDSSNELLTESAEPEEPAAVKALQSLAERFWNRRLEVVGFIFFNSKDLEPKAAAAVLAEWQELVSVITKESAKLKAAKNL